MPPQAQINPPTLFSVWKKNPSFFDDDLSWTQTEVINDASLNGKRYAYGASQEGFWFNVEFEKDTDELEFWSLYIAWRAKATASSKKKDAGVGGTDHSFASADAATKPKNCGTPTTPPCPPPDDLDQAVQSLAKELVPVGSDPAVIDAARLQVRKMLIATAKATKVLVDNT